MRVREESVRVSIRGSGVVGAHQEMSPESRQEAAMLGGRCCRCCGARAGKWGLHRGSPGDGECARVVEGARSDGGWPELKRTLAGAVVVSEHDLSGLVAVVCG